MDPKIIDQTSFKAELQGFANQVKEMEFWIKKAVKWTQIRLSIWGQSYSR